MISKYLRLCNFIKKRGLFNSQFWRFKGKVWASSSALVEASKPIVTQQECVGKHMKNRSSL